MGSFKLATVIPCLNEKEHILNCLESLRNQTFDNSKHLIWILDGGSTDGTIEIIENYIQNLDQNHSPKIELHHNEKKFVPHARNFALKELPDSIEFIVEMIAHCTVPNDHYERREEAWNRCYSISEKGGKKLAALGVRVLPAEGNMTVQESWIESCLSSRFGGGSGQFASFSKEERTKVPAFVTHDRSALKAVDGWSEKFETSQDSDLSMRLLSSNFELMRTPSTHVNMRKRNNLANWWKMSVRYGFWRTKILMQYPSRASLREFLPLFGILITIFLAIWFKSFASIPLLAYGIVLILVGINSMLYSKTISSIFGTPLCMIILHTGFSLGLIQGLIKKGKVANDR